MLGLLLWALATGVQAQDFTYTTNAGAITITGYTGPGGSSYFSDPQWTNHPARFYRLRSP